MAETNSVLPLGGRPVVLSLDADVAVAEELDAGSSGSKRAAVLSCTVNAQAVFMLVRIQEGPNGLFLDIVADSSLANVVTRVGNMELDGRSHPSPIEDAIDTAVLAAAA